MAKTKIAIIEDDVAIAQMYRLKFEAEGFDVAVAENGVIGLGLPLGDVSVGRLGVDFGRSVAGLGVNLPADGSLDVVGGAGKLLGARARGGCANAALFEASGA